MKLQYAKTRRGITMQEALDLSKKYTRAPRFFCGIEEAVKATGNDNYFEISALEAWILAASPLVEVIWSSAVGGRPCEIIVQDRT